VVDLVDLQQDLLDDVVADDLEVGLGGGEMRGRGQRIYKKKGVRGCLGRRRGGPTARSLVVPFPLPYFSPYLVQQVGDVFLGPREKVVDADDLGRWEEREERKRV